MSFMKLRSIRLVGAAVVAAGLAVAGFASANAAPQAIPQAGADAGAKPTITVTKTVKWGKKAKITGKAEVGKTVTLQRKIPGTKWNTIATKTAKANGTFAFKAEVRSTTFYRVKVDGAGTSKKAKTRLKGLNATIRAIHDVSTTRCVGWLKTDPDFFPNLTDPTAIYAADLNAKTGKPGAGEIVVKGEHARWDGGRCWASGIGKDTGQAGASLFFQKSDAGTWEYAFFSQAIVPCTQVDGQGWPTEVLDVCWDETTKTERAAK
jgi:hypothetical protein